MLAWAAVRGYRPKGDNPARWKGHLDQALPKRSRVAKVDHHAAMSHHEVPAFMPQLAAQRYRCSGTSLRILTAARTSEVLGARWSEIDFKDKTWTVPASRMKAGKEHRVPLAPQVIDLLQNCHAMPSPLMATVHRRRCRRAVERRAMAAVLSGWR